jgi:hypothetical protein
MKTAAGAVLMVAPTTFDYDRQTAESNAFQTKLDLSRGVIKNQVRAEFAACVKALREAGVQVVVHEFHDRVKRPSAVFPNNWLSTWPDGRIYLYPMATASRRAERNDGVTRDLSRNFEVRGVVDLSGPELKGKYLESTGVMVFDHSAKVAYGCLSVRCDSELFLAHAKALGYQAHLFHSYGASGAPVYHTNVMMAVQAKTAVVCLESVRDAAERTALVAAIEAGGHEIIDITMKQMARFCGNVMQLHPAGGPNVLLMSQSAHDAFDDTQLHALAQDNVLVPVAVPTIEALGGGSVRCMVAEIFLPRRVPATL